MKATPTEQSGLELVEISSDEILGNASSGWKCPQPPPRTFMRFVPVKEGMALI
jgi:hypothetical protein